MKRVALILMCFVLLLATAATGTAQAAITGHDFTGRFVYSDDPNISVADKNGDGYEAYVGGVIISVEVSDNTAFQNAGYSLVVRRVTEAEPDAFAWFEERAGNVGTDRLYYEIYIIDACGERVTADFDFNIRFTLPESYSNPIAYSLSAYGELKELLYRLNGAGIEFTTKSGDYIVIAREGSALEPTPTPIETQEPSPTPADPNIPPKTGDMSLTAAATAAVILGFGALCIKKKKRS